MTRRKRVFLLSIIMAVLAGALLLVLTRLQVESNLISSLPGNDPVLKHSREIFQANPIQNVALVSLTLTGSDPGILHDAAEEVKEKMYGSGLFRSVGVEEMGESFTEMLFYTARNLPILFSEEELKKAKPNLEKEKVRLRVREIYRELTGFGGIGQGELISRDPLQLRHLQLKKMAGLLPVGDVRYREGNLVSSDGRHLLVIARTSPEKGEPLEVDSFLNDLKNDLERKYDILVHHAGAYRASADNESMIRADVRRAVMIATVCIILLLVFSFPRPWIGLLALLPALSGILLAMAIFALFGIPLSLIAIGFGGAIVSISVDHGVAYILFLDRPYRTEGKRVARYVRNLGLLAVITSVGAFFFLGVSGFRVFSQIGQFAALGILFSFISLHLFFPVLVPSLPPAKRSRSVLLQRLTLHIDLKRLFPLLAGLTLIFASVILFRPPHFAADIRSMNSLRPDTLKAEEAIQETWGDWGRSGYLMIRAEDTLILREKNDRIHDIACQVGVRPALLTTDFFPSMDVRRKNLASWKEFWNRERREELRRTFSRAAREEGLRASVFEPFFEKLKDPEIKEIRIDDEMLDLFGVRKEGDGLVQYVPVQAESKEKAFEFFNGISKMEGVRYYDPGLFTERLSRSLARGFFLVLGLVAAGVTIFLFFYFLDIRLLLLSLAPVFFALLATMAILSLTGGRLGLPALMLSVVIFGMGIDYSLYYIRSFQFSGSEREETLGLIRLTILVAGASTFFGFASLSFSSHALLENAGIVTGLGIAGTLVSTLIIVPWGLEKIESSRNHKSIDTVEPGSRKHRTLTLKRYSGLEAGVRLFARFKMILDPMFPRLLDFIGDGRVILDIGCGYGVPSSWLMTVMPEIRVYGIDPDDMRVRAASRAWEGRGVARVGSAPSLPEEGGRADTILLVDVIHYLDDEECSRLFENCARRLHGGGRVVIRVTVPLEGKRTFFRFMEDLAGKPTVFRSVAHITRMASEKNLSVCHTEPTASGREETWIILYRRREGE